MSRQRKDWDRFFKIYDEISSTLLLLPEIYAYDNKHSLILEEDCGFFTLKDFTKDNNSLGSIKKVYQNVIDALIYWHAIKAEKNSTIASRTLNKEMLLWETSYFANHCVSEYFGLDKLLTSHWEDERQRLADEVAALPLVCIHRDFQSENIMIKNKRIKFVDYQGARLGPAEYDVASLLFDPYVSILDEKTRNELLDYYNNKNSSLLSVHTLHIAALQRLCQALGAYGNLSLHKGKRKYKKYITPALNNLFNILRNDDQYPCLKKIVDECLKRTNVS